MGKPRSLPKKSDNSRSRRNSESYVVLERDGVRSSSQDRYIYTRVGGKQRNALPSPELPPDLGRGNLLTESALHKQEQILPKKKNLLLEKALPSEQDLVLVYKSKFKSRRDSVMASGYRDDYRETGYRGENDRPRSQPPRSRYYDDEDSDYDERTGERQRGGGRGYDDRDRDDYDTVREVREVYRGPVSSGPLALVVREA